MSDQADICLILEGTYPYVSGGVAYWTHDLIQRQPHLKFHLVSINPPKMQQKMIFDLPRNVVGFTDIYLQELPKGSTTISKARREKFFEKVELPLLKLQHFGRLEDLKHVVEVFKEFPEQLGSFMLMESEEAWHMLVRMYLSTMGESSFLNFYWSWRGLLSSFYSILLSDLPNCKVYHAVCTGYAGLLLARAYLETGRPCLITEHGIYTNERRIEITVADWLYDQSSMDLNIDRLSYDRDLKDYWIDTFFGYSRLCYEACTKIITLFKGNQAYQIADGADPSKMLVIPNGVDFKRFSKIIRDTDHQPTIALIGRVVPIKDVKNFIHASAILKEKVPNLKALILGSTEEDPEYFKECEELVRTLNLQETVHFTGKVNTDDYLSKIDIVILTSISESQPLVILEAGAAGIPCVTTDAGSCQELIYGKLDEAPPLGPGGAISPLSNPASIADNSYLLLSDRNFYDACGKAIQERVRKYYNSEDLTREYREIYHNLMQETAKAGVH